MTTESRPAIKLDSEIEALLLKFPVVMQDDLTKDNLARFRKGKLPMDPLSGEVDYVDHVVREDPRLTVRIHTLKAGAKTDRPCVFSMHGGGYVAGSVDFDDGLFDAMCRQTNCVGISVDYRLAPESPYPIPIEDCYTALAWVFENAAELGIDSKRVGLHGVSGGGGLAAALALMVRDRGTYRLAYQLLDCPMLDDRQITPSSQADALVGWSKQSNAFGWQSYLGDLYGTDDVPYLAAPARATDLSNLPPAYICVGGADGFRDEDINYALQLEACGTPCELHVYPGGPHGVMLFTTTDIGARYVRDKNHWLKLKIETARVDD